jgi:ribosomal protein L12E/L44/L45/RPP1/RPP2
MTKELQHAMAEYEEARIRYRKAVLASLNGESNGDAIREAIQAFQAARAELAREGGAPVASAPKAEPARAASPAWSFVRRLLQAS